MAVSNQMGNVVIESTMQKIGYLGQFLSGLAFIITALIAVATLFLYHRKQLDDAWLDRFRDLYKEFWNDKDMQLARHMVNNSDGYKVLEDLLFKRNAMEECNISWEEYKQLEIMDKFFSVMTRVRSFGKSIDMSEIQEEIWGELLYIFWIKRISERHEMRVYVSKHWPNLLEPITVKRKKKYIIL